MKKYDLAVKVGEYQDNQGNTKGRYENIGAVMDKGDGPYILLKRTFNPAGMPNPDNRDSIVVSCYEPKQQQSRQAAGNYPNQTMQSQVTPPQQQAPQQQAPQQPQYDSDLPF